MAHRSLIIGLSWILYYVVVTFGLHLFDAGVLVTQGLLFGVPALLLLWWTQAPSAVVVAVSTFGIGLGVLLEGAAHFYGIWESNGVAALPTLTATPIEMVVSVMLQTLFLTLCYEALFDDVTYTLRSARERLVFFFLFAVAALGLVALHFWFGAGWSLSYSYAWLIGSMVISALLALSLHKQLSIRVFDKVIDFCLVAAMPLGLSLWLAVENQHKLFLSGGEYTSVVYFFGHTVPIEEVLLLFALPFLVATIYEMYLDDQA